MSETYPVTAEGLTVAAKLEALTPIKEFVLYVATAAGLDKKATYKLRLAVDELATNIISYSYAHSVRPGLVRLEARIDQQNLTLCLEDEGQIFDPTQAEAPDLNLSLEDRPIGGLGVFLAQQSVDELRYERNGNLNRTTLVIKRPIKEQGFEIQN